ncbi:hypothetical protein HYV57_01890 [Candidatus Peregrinibacteria bacterium]|nr:hypothetical protein [Candidatus Peregrinibacteria bacterium]
MRQAYAKALEGAQLSEESDTSEEASVLKEFETSEEVQVSEVARKIVSGKMYVEILEHDGIFEVKVLGNALEQPVLGTAFDFRFNPKILEYDSYKAGSFFEQSGTTPIYLITPSKTKEGMLVVGISLRRGDSLPQGSGHFVSFLFRVRDSGRANFTFENVSLASLDVKKREIENVSWIDSETEVNQSSSESFLKTDILEKKFSFVFVFIVFGSILTIIGCFFLVRRKFLYLFTTFWKR